MKRYTVIWSIYEDAEFPLEAAAKAYQHMLTGRGKCFGVIDPDTKEEHTCQL